MNLLNMVDSALYQRLTTTSGTALYGTRVYSPVAPVNATYPFVVFNPTVFISDNRSAKRTFMVEYQFDCWAKTPLLASQCLAKIDENLLHKPLLFADYVCMSMRAREVYKSYETFANEQIYRAGMCFSFEITEK